MIEEHATVLGLQGHLAVIGIQRQNACNHCELNAGCGTGSLGRLLGQRSQQFSIDNTHNLKPGDHIVIGLPDRHYLAASFLMYILPLLMLFVFGLLARLLFGGSETLTTISALAGLGLGIALTIRLSHSHFARRFQPRFLRRELEISIL